MFVCTIMREFIIYNFRPIRKRIMFTIVQANSTAINIIIATLNHKTSKPTWYQYQMRMRKDLFQGILKQLLAALSFIWAS